MGAGTTIGRDLIIIGAGGHGREVLSVLVALEAEAQAEAAAVRHRDRWRVLGFAADQPVTGEALKRVRRVGQRLLGTIDDAARAHPHCDVVVAIGDPLARADASARAARAGLVLAPALFHPSVSVGLDVHAGPGVVVQAGSHITTNVRIGIGVQINLSCSVGHDVELGDHATLAPGCCLGGGVVVGHGARLGAGVVVASGSVVGAHAQIGTGAVLTSDVEPGEVVPAGFPRPFNVSG